MKIIVDVMGGDNAPLELVKGVCRATADTDADFILVGDGNAIRRVAKDNGLDISSFEIHHTDEVVKMTDDPITAIRKKPGSSMMTGLRLLAEGEGDAFVSTGNTGALFAGSTHVVRRIKGIQRAGIASVIPLANPVLLLDSGANLNLLPEHLEAFAVMGSAYMNRVFGVKNPRVGLLNNGSEECKGTELQVEAYKLLSANKTINFVGNVEANKLPTDVCDVLVTDGFTGNILLKSIEGMGKVMINSLKDIFLTSGVTKLSALLVKKELGALKKKYDTREYGGAALFGLKKPVIKAHGNSDAKAFSSAIKQAISFAGSGVIDVIEKEAEALREKRLSEEELHGDEGIK